MRRTAAVFGFVALALAGASCSSTTRSGSSPVYLVIDTFSAAQGNHSGSLGSNLTSDVLTLVTSPPPCSTTAPCPTVFNDVGSVKMRLSLKNLGAPGSPASPTLNNEVTITRYHVQYVRADGRNTPGVDVPYPFDGAVTGTVPASGALTLGFELVRVEAKAEAPLVQLVSSGTIISTIANVTFYGQDQVGNQISVTGSITIDFGNFADQ